MTEKNWLIRTRKSQLLGPVTKQKILEFIQKGALNEDDEITSGNGYWFSVSEKDLLSKYVEGDLLQTFNPISEAPNVLTLKEDSSGTHSIKPQTMPADLATDVIDVDAKGAVNEEDNTATVIPESNDLEYPDMIASSTEEVENPGMVAPSAEDLEYPDMDSVQVNAPLVKESIAPVKVQAAQKDISQEIDDDAILPTDDDLEYPSVDGVDSQELVIAEDGNIDIDMSGLDMTTVNEMGEPKFDSVISNNVEVEKTPVKLIKKAQKTQNKIQNKTQRRRAKPKRNDAAYLIILFTLVAVALGGIYYYYTKVLNKELVLLENLNPIRSVSAQSAEPILKKKV